MDLLKIAYTKKKTERAAESPNLRADRPTMTSDAGRVLYRRAVRAVLIIISHPAQLVKTQIKKFLKIPATGRKGKKENEKHQH